MTRIFLCALLILTLVAIGQNTLAPEDKIYQKIDAFVANPVVENLANLNAVEKAFWKNTKPKTKAELLAIVVLNCNKAYYEKQFNLTTAAVRSYENAWEIYQKYRLSNYDIVEYCLKPLGNLYTILGDYDNAENTIKQYFYIATQEKNQDKKIAAILNLSNVYQNSGKINSAIDLLEKTIRTEKLSKTQKGILLNNLGNNYLLTYKNTDLTRPIIPTIFKKLESSYLDAIQLLQSDKTQRETLANCYRNLSALHAQWHNYELANTYFEKAKNYFSITANLSPRKIAKFKYEEASLLFQQGKTTESAALITAIFKLLIPNYSNKKSVLPQQSSVYAETALLDALDLQAAIFSKQNQPKKALETFSLAFHIEDLFSHLLVYENAKIINQIRIRNRTEKCLAIYDLLYQREHKQNDLVAAFQLAERTKSGVLKSYLLKNKTASKAEKSYIKQLQNWSNEILREQQKGDLANIIKINEAIQKQNELMLSLKKIRSENLDPEKETLDMKALFEKLEKDKAVMIHYFSGHQKMYYFIITNNSISLHSLNNNAHSTARIWQFIDYFKDSNTILNDVKGYNHYGKIAYDFLRLPQNTSYKNWVIIPDGLLNFLPFEALITKESNTSNFTKMHYLVNDYAISYNNSARFYLDSNPLTKGLKRILGIFPVFENTAYELRFSKDEMQSIKKKIKGDFFENNKATFDNFKNKANQYPILHLSTHADAGDTETPAKIKFFDQEILYPELYQLHINPDLVVLSACETGIGKLYKSEGAMSIARGFQFAGAQNLLFSLWKVNDFTTSVFMENFYQNIKKNLPFFEANRQAKLDYLNDTNIPNAKKTPYYWSAFVYYGTLEKNEAPLNYWYAILGIVLGIALIWFLIRIRK